MLLLLAVLTIIVAVTVSYWMGALTSIASKHEQIEFPNASARRLEDGSWVITAELKNTGSMDATIDLLYINGKKPSDFGPEAIVVTPSLPLSLQVGSGVKAVSISVKAGTPGFITGTTIEVSFRSSSGRNYPKQVMLI